MSSSMESSETGASADVGSERDREIRRFLDFIGSQGRSERGGVVFNRLAGSFAKLQHEYVAGPALNDTPSLTVRYRLNSGNVFGTLFAALITDFAKIVRGETTSVPTEEVGGETNSELIGAFDPVFNDKIWKSRLQGLKIMEPWMQTNFASAGVIDSKLLDDIFSWLSVNFASALNFRLIIFAEIYGSDGDEHAVEEWRKAQTLLFQRLLGRITLVLSGVPEGFDIPTGPDFLEISLVDEEERVTTKVSRFIAAPILTDRPTTDDTLGIQDYASALARFILHSETRPPLTIGIHGPWGKGKSSFMEMIDLSLIATTPASRAAFREHIALAETLRTADPKSPITPDALREQSEKRNQLEILWKRVRSLAKKDIVSIRFNAWQFQDATQTWAGLAHVISETLERELPIWRRAALRIAYAWKRQPSEIILNLLPLVLILLVAIILFVIPEARADLQAVFAPDIKGVLKFVFPFSSFLVLTWLLAWRINKVVQPVSERVAGYLKRPDYKLQMGYQHRVMEDLQFVHRHLKKFHKWCRVVVYVDDLDRCSDEKIMEILQATNLILANCDFFVFLGMDTGMIYRAIRTHYEKDNDLPEYFAEQYLRKILQLSFHLPETPSEKLFELASGLFSRNSRDTLRERSGGKSELQNNLPPQPTLEPSDELFRYDMKSVHRPVTVEDIEDVQDTPDELEVFRDYQKFLSDNPREIKRLVNVHRLVKILLQRTDASSSVRRQRLLTKWLIFCSRWPDLVDDILQNAKENPEAGDSLSMMIDELEIDDAEKHLLKNFALPNPPLNNHDDRFDAATCRDFALAAQLSQMLTIVPAPRKMAAPPSAEPDIG